MELAPGDHVCALFAGRADRDRLVRAFLGAGHEDGDRCLCIAAGSPGDILGKATADLESLLGSGQLDVRPAEDTYLRTGRFTTTQMIEFLHRYVADAIDAGASFVRVAGDACWTRLDSPGADEFLSARS